MTWPKREDYRTDEEFRAALSAAWAAARAASPEVQREEARATRRAALRALRDGTSNLTTAQALRLIAAKLTEDEA